MSFPSPARRPARTDSKTSAPTPLLIPGFLLVVALLLSSTGGSALAGGNPNAKIILHVVPWNNRHTCTAGQPGPAGPSPAEAVS